MARKPRKTFTLAQQRRDPAKRSRLATSQLTPVQQRQRRVNTRIARDNANPLYDPTQQLAGHELQRAASQITEAGVKPKEMALSREMNSATAQGTALAGRSAGYYRDLATREAEGIARKQALDASLGRDLSQIGQRSSDALQTMSKNEEQHQQEDINRRGSGLKGTDNAISETAAAKANSALSQQNAENQAATQAGNWTDYLKSIRESTSLKGGEVNTEMLNRLANQQADIRGRQSDLAATKGDEFVKNLLGLRDTSFTNMATMQGLGIKKSDLQAQIEKARGDQAIARQRITSAARTNRANRQSREGIASAGLDVRKQAAAETHRHNVAVENKPGATGDKHLQDVRTKAGKAWANVESSLGLISSGARVPITANGKQVFDSKGQAKTRPATTDETIAELRNRKAPEWAIQAAISIRHHGYIIPAVVDIIRHSAPEVRIPTKYRTKPARRPKKGPPAPAGPAGAVS